MSAGGLKLKLCFGTISFLSCMTRDIYSTVISPSRFEVRAVVPRWGGPTELIQCTTFYLPPGKFYMSGKQNEGMFRTLHHLSFIPCKEPRYLDPAGYKMITRDMDTITGSPFFPCIANASRGPEPIPCQFQEKKRHITLPIQEHPEYGFEMGDLARFFVLSVHYTGETTFDHKIEMKVVFDDHVDKVIDNFGLEMRDFILSPLSTVYLNCTLRLRSNGPAQVRYIDSHSHHSAELQEIYTVDKEGVWRLVLRTRPGPARNVVKNVVIKDGEVIAWRCKMVNSLNETLIESRLHEGGDSCAAQVTFSHARNATLSAPEIVDFDTCLGPEESARALKGTSYPPEDSVWPENDMLGTK